MIVQRDWMRVKRKPGPFVGETHRETTVWRGWFLLGFIPLYVVMRSRQVVL